MDTLAQLEDATAFERFALDSAAPVSTPQYGWVDLRKAGDMGFIIGAASCGAEAADRLRLELRPLMFGSAWKIMDLVVEYGLQCAPPSGQHWSIREKVERARSQADLVPWAPFAAGDAEWDATLRMYAEAEELRHGLVHRTIRRDVSTGAFEVVGQRGSNAGRTFYMSDAEQLAFCRATRRLIQAILARHIEPRQRDDLAYQLAQVHEYSGVLPSSDEQLRYICELHIDLREAAHGWAELDVAALDAAMESQRGSHRAFDLVAYRPNAPGAAPLVGKLEGASLDRPVTRFRVESPPSWLSSSRSRHTL